MHIYGEMVTNTFILVFNLFGRDCIKEDNAMSALQTKILEKIGIFVISLSRIVHARSKGEPLVFQKRWV